MLQGREFSQQDAQTIVGIIENTPLQNMKAAREAQGLVERFLLFTKVGFAAQAARGAKKEKDDSAPSN